MSARKPPRRTSLSLSEMSAEQVRRAEAPLAARMRPRDLDEVVGQEAVVGPGTPLREAIEQDRLTSMILYGPPGTGKTTLARILARRTRAHFVAVNAVTTGVAEIRALLDEAEARLGLEGIRTVLFVDEIHRLNRAQQDVLLPAVEEGTAVLIGATTENPYFTVHGALLSRAPVVRLQPLSEDALRQVVVRALSDRERGLGGQGVTLTPEALDHLVRMAQGDARVALTTLERAVAATPPCEDGTRLVTLERVARVLDAPALRYDREGDNHYDLASAFIKSIRGSDPDAALYWMVRMLEAGEDPRFVARRLVIHAAEDVGLADPRALLVAVAAHHALEFVGMPEAAIPLAEATLYLSLAPKSNSVVEALAAARRAVREGKGGEVPAPLRDNHYPGAAQLGHGVGYRYPHDFPGHVVAQQYLPTGLEELRVYVPGTLGEEGSLVAGWRERLRAAGILR